MDPASRYRQRKSEELTAMKNAVELWRDMLAGQAEGVSGPDREILEDLFVKEEKARLLLDELETTPPPELQGKSEELESALSELRLALDRAADAQ
jgi:hypothetical protein